MGAQGQRKDALEAAPAPEKDWGPTKPTTVREALRDAMALAMNVPARCWSVSPGSVASDPRLSFRSLAYSGRAVLRVSIDIVAAPKKGGGPGCGPP